MNLRFALEKKIKVKYFVGFPAVMNSLSENIKKAFWLFGERTALITVVLFYLLILSFQSTKNAYSKEEEQFLRQTPVYESYSKENEALKSSIPNPLSVAVEVAKITPTPTPTPNQSFAGDDVWERLAMCESKGNWSIDTGNGYFGGLQFSQGAWNSVGGTGKPSDSSKEEQINRGKMLQEKRGWGVWGECAKRLKL